MALFIGALIMLGIALVLLIIARARGRADDSNAKDDRLVLRIVGGVFVLGFLLAAFFSSFTTVSTKNVGIVTTFGHPDGELSNGGHFVAPWSKVTEMNAAIQTDTYLGKTDQGSDACVDVRLANQSVACVEVTIRWRIQPNSARELFRDYKSFEHVRDSLVTRELRSALNDQFSTFDPLGELQAGHQPTDILDPAGLAVAAKLKTQIGQQVEVLSVIIPIVNFDPTTQTRINQFNQALQDTRIAAQKVLTAKQQALANDALQKSLKNDPLVLISKCLDLVEQGKTPPGTCLPLTGTTGSVLVTAPTGK